MSFGAEGGAKAEDGSRFITIVGGRAVTATPAEVIRGSPG